MPAAALTHWSQYLALRAVAGMIQCADTDVCLRAAAALGRTVHEANPRRRRRAEAHVEQAFPDWPRERLRATARGAVEHAFGLFLVDALVMTRLITPASWPRYVRLDGVQPLVNRLVRGDPMILVTGHCGNWELLGHLLALLGYPVHALARPLDNPLINRWLVGLREARGTRIITKWGATPVLVEALRGGGRLGFIADQDAGDGGLFVPFFGRLASSYKSIALLAMRYEVPIVAGFARRLDGRLRYEAACVDIIDPADWVDQPDPLFYITARYNRAIEEMIRRAPNQYYWPYRRWRSRPAFERRGRDLPARLQERLESLPWMTPEELRRLVRTTKAPPDA